MQVHSGLRHLPVIDKVLSGRKINESGQAERGGKDGRGTGRGRRSGGKAVRVVQGAVGWAERGKGEGWVILFQLNG